ncbi:50S ribosomal protein L37ae [Candidatus Woesearchaeota archaeon]|nr:hypothetical protein [uncultured archaeon]MBS3167262.1 50S ribosomal protein L37ae [Candidatus Woesearchaeota archaeon]
MRTKKVGSSGRYGARYGLRIRRRIQEIDKRRSETKKCPFCFKNQLKRVNAGIWLCKKCGKKFTGGAYSI